MLCVSGGCWVEDPPGVPSLASLTCAETLGRKHRWQPGAPVRLSAFLGFHAKVPRVDTQCAPMPRAMPASQKSLLPCQEAPGPQLLPCCRRSPPEVPGAAGLFDCMKFKHMGLCFPQALSV